MSITRCSRLMLHALSLLALMVAPALAQNTSGVIDGTILGPDGQPVPRVQVVANSPALIQRDLTVYSNEEGYYRLASLPPGSYTIRYSLQGFQRIERHDLIVSTGQTTSADAALTLATVEESVTVTGASPTIDPTSAKLGFNYTQQLLQNVPTTRQFHNIVTTIPGVETANVYGTSPGNLENESVLGAGPFGNRYTMDGGNVTTGGLGANQANLFSADIIQEMQVLRGAKPAEVGFAQGGFFSIVTKSGGNRFSGETSAYFQGKGLESENIDDRLRQAGVTRANQLVDDRDLSFSAGGRIIRDRLWWYGSARRQDRTFRVLGFNRDVEDKINAFFWKNTFQASTNHRFAVQANYWNEFVNYFFFGFAPALAAGPEVSMLRKPGGDAAQGRWDGVLGKNVVAEAVVGWNNFRLHQLFQPDAKVNVIDLISGKRFGNPGNGSRASKENNYDATGSVSWFVPDALGRHDFKAGGQYTHSPFAWTFDEINEHQLRTQGGAPFSVIIENTPVNAKWLQKYASFYAQDAWTIAQRLTLNLGVRYDHIRAITPEQSSGGGDFAATYLAVASPGLLPQAFPQKNLWSWNSLAPRAAVAFDVDRTRQTVLKGGYARYYHFLNAQQVWSANPNFPLFITYRWNDPNNDGSFQLGEEGTLLSRTGGSNTGVDPDIRHPYSDEFTIGIGRELFKDFSLNANFIYRTDNDLIYTTNSGIPFGTYTPTSITDPGPDGVTGGGDDASLTVFAQDPATFGRGKTFLTNPSRAGFENGRAYRGFEVIGNKRLSNRWQFVGSVVVSKMEVTTPTSESGGAIGNIFQNPNNVLNARGIDDLNQKYQVKLQGTYMARYGIVLSGLYRYGSGLPYTRQLVVRGLPQGPFTVFAEPRGARKSDAYHWTDLRAEKTFTLPGAGSRKRVGLTFDLFNISNASTVLQYGSRTGVDLGVPRAVHNPRIARLGARFAW